MSSRATTCARLRLLCTLLYLLPSVASAQAEPKSAHHHLVSSHTKIIEASVELKVDQFPQTGLVFFAIQGNYTGGGSAHGGIMRSGDELKANWGGLAGEGSKAGTTEELKAYMELVQNQPERSIPFTWDTGRWYRLTISRGPEETLPAGDYSALDEPPTHIDHPRTMRRWDFTVTDVASDEVVFSHKLHTKGETMSDWGYWTETGYGVSCTDELVAHFRRPRYREEGNEAGPHQYPQLISRSVYQSECDWQTTTHIATESHAELGTVQYYGSARPNWARHGTTLYAHGVPLCAQGQQEGCGDEGPPTVRILSPASGATVDSTFEVEVEVEDDLMIHAVELMVSDKTLAVAKAPPYTLEAGPFGGGGPLSLVVRATDVSGARGSARLDVVIKAQPAPPRDSSTGSASDGGTSSGNDGGDGCAVAGVPPLPYLGAAFLLLLAITVRRRRHG